jgi:hypothetical protein
MSYCAGFSGASRGRLRLAMVREVRVPCVPGLLAGGW